MTELERLLKKSGNVYLESSKISDGFSQLQLQVINKSAVLPYEEIVIKFPNLNRLYLSPLWLHVNMEYIIRNLNLDEGCYGGRRYIHPDAAIATWIDNAAGVIPRSLGENNKLQELSIIRNFVFDNIFEEISKLSKLRKLVFFRNRIMRPNQYEELNSPIFLESNSGFWGGEKGENEISEETSIIPIGKLSNLESLELINKGIKYIPNEFNNLESLKAINLSWNTNLDVSELKRLKNLEHVRMNNINLKTIPQYLIDSSKTLKSVEITGNPITEVEGIKQLLKQNKEITLIVDNDVREIIENETKYKFKRIETYLWKEIGSGYVELDCCNLKQEKEEYDISTCETTCGRRRYVGDPSLWVFARRWWVAGHKQ